MDSSELSFTHLLKEAQAFPEKDREQMFLERFPGEEAKYALIKKIIDVCDNSSPLDLAKQAITNAVDEVSSDEFIGKVFDNWLVSDVIAITNKSIILKAKPADKSYDQLVAIKIASPMFRSISSQTHIKKQAHLMEVLKHPNLIELKGAGSSSGVDYLAMEYLSGLNIVQHCQNNALSLKQILSLFKQVCSCVSNMHSYSVIHSDIKPDNILMNSQDIVKILDFDLSNVQNEQINSTYDYDNVDGQTKEYASPEQLVSGVATKQSDVFALGKVLYEMLTGQKYTLNNSLDNKEEMLKKHGSSNFVLEALSIITKACKIVPQERYMSVDELLIDVQHVFSSSVVKAHKPKYLFCYRIFKKLKFNLKIALALFIMSLAIFFSLIGIFVEQGFSTNSINALTSSVDPRRLDSKNAFDTLANDVYHQTWVFKDSQFKQLIDFGEAYYGSGNIEQSIKFFSKAKSLYTDKMSSEYITVTSKLALAKYTLGYIQDALDDLDEYRSVIFNGKKLEDPALIEMLFTIIEVNSQVRYLQWLEDEEYSTNETLKFVDLSQFTEEEKKENANANLLYFNSIDIYYNLEHGDSSSSSVLHSESEYQDITKPELLRAKSLMERALKIINTNELSSHRKPLIYLWLGRLNSELRNDELAISYADDGVKLTKLLFGLEHPRVTGALLKQYAAIRNVDPVQAYNAVKNAVSIANNYQKNQYTIFTHLILLEAALNHGDLKYARIAFTNALDNAKYQSDNDDLSFIDLDAITSMMMSFKEFVFHHSLEQDFVPYLKENSKYMKVLKNNREEVISDFDILELFLERLALASNTNEISKDLYKYFNSKLELARTNAVVYDFRFEGMNLADLCSKLAACDTGELLALIAPYEAWTAQEDKRSFDKLLYNIRKANHFIYLGKYVEANKSVEEVRLILDYVFTFNPTNAYIALFNEIKIKYYIKVGDFKAAKQLINDAFYISSLHFPKSARIYKSLEDLKTLLESKDN